MRKHITKNYESVTFLRNLYRSTFRFLVPLTTEKTYPVISEAALRLFDAQYCSIFIKKKSTFERVWDSSKKMFRVEADKGGYAFRSVKFRKPSVVHSDQLEKKHPHIVDWGIKSITFIPLYYRNSAIGYIALDSVKKIELSSKKSESLKIFGSLAMLAIRKAQLYSALEVAVKNRDLFISIASHELRTPLTTINSYSQLLEKKIISGEEVNPKWVGILSSEAKRMSLMVNELLQIEQIKTGQLEYKWDKVNLKEVIKRAMINLSARFPHHRVNFENELGKNEGIIMGDFDKLLQALLNILVNSAKFSVADSNILIRLSYKSPYLRLSVKDEGIGIPEKELPRIFEESYAGSSPKKGLGIGLFLTKSIIEMHQGKINVFSKVNEGTIVELRINPLKQKKATFL